jgi:hypothetical protein
MDDPAFQVLLDQRGRTYTELAPFAFDLHGLTLLIVCQHGPFGYSYRAEAHQGDQIAYGQLLHRSMGFDHVVFLDMPAWMGAALTPTSGSPSAAVTEYPSQPGNGAITRIPVPPVIALAIRGWADDHRNRGRRHVIHGHWRTPAGQIVVSQYAGRTQTQLTLDRWDSRLAHYVCVCEVAGTTAESLALAAAIALIAQAEAVPIDPFLKPDSERAADQ